jgi:hypothetical protein
MVRFVPLLLIAPGALSFQVPQGRSTSPATRSRPFQAVAIGTDPSTGMPIPQLSDKDSGAMIDLTGVAMSVST